MSIYDAKQKQNNARFFIQLLLYPYSLPLGAYTPSTSIKEAKKKQKTARITAQSTF